VIRPAAPPSSRPVDVLRGYGRDGALESNVDSGCSGQFSGYLGVPLRGFVVRVV